MVFGVVAEMRSGMENGEPEDRDSSNAEDANLLRFNESFYMTSPADYLRIRLNLALLAAGKTEELQGLLEDGVEFEGLTLRAAPSEDEDEDDDDEGDERAVGRFVAIESQQLLHHACETALRMFLVHSAAPSAPWIELAGDRNFGKFKEAVRSTFVDSTPDPDLIAWVCLGATAPGDGVSAPDWADAIEGIGLFLQAFGRCILDDASLYNGIKHGLGVKPGDAMLLIGSHQVGHGPSIEYPESGPWEGDRREWSLTTQWLDLTYSFGLAQAAIELTDSIWTIGRFRYIGVDEVHRFFPKSVRPGDLRGSRQAPAPRMSWRLVVERLVVEGRPD